MKTKLFFLSCLIFIIHSPIFAQEFHTLISYEKIESINTDELKQKWKENNIPQIMIPIKYDVDIYEIRYHTLWHDGSIIEASGLYFVPNQNKYKVPLMLYNHGTTMRRRQGFSFSGQLSICLGFATDGYAVAFQDYIGLGTGEKFHLYQHADSEGQSGVDMLRAVKELNKSLGIYWDMNLFITGYSQGGHATLAAHRKIQQEYSGQFKVTASSPMSGAYDMAGAQAGVMFEEYSKPFYLPYLLNSYNEAYGIIEGDVHQIYNEPYDTLIPKLFDGSMSLSDINSQLPSVPSTMVKDSIVNLFVTDPNFPFSKAIEENEVYKWVPKAPVQLCYCTSDEQVSYINSIVAHDTMKYLGAKKVLLKLSGRNHDHNTCAIFTSINTKFFFDNIRKGKPYDSKCPIFKRFLASLSKMKVNSKPPKKERRKERSLSMK